MAYIDYYKTLGVTKAASQDEVKKAYKKLARKHHPDLNPNDTSAQKRFQELNEANEVLGDPEKRKKYDRYGEHWKHADQFEAQQQPNSTGGHYGGFSSGGQSFTDDEAHFSDFFASMFGDGGAGRRRGGFRGQDYNAELHLTLRNAATTHKQVLDVNGKSIRITVPAGVENGQVIKLKGQGEGGQNGGHPGDLYITFVIAEDDVFKRTGADLQITASLDLYTAILGGEQVIETLDGKVKLNIAPETQNATKVRLKGKGFPVYKKEGHYGDLIVTWVIQLPRNLTPQQQEMFRELQKISS